MSTRIRPWPHKLSYCIGVRDGKRVTLFVDGQIDETGVERMPVGTARLLDAVLDGGPYDHLPHVEEPIASSEAPPVAGASSRAGDRFVTTASSAV